MSCRPHSISSRIRIAVAILLAATFARSAAAADVVGRVGGIEVSSAEIRAYVATLGAQEQAALGKDPALLSQVVRSYLALRAVLKEAQARKWDQEPSVKAQLDRVRDQALTELYLQSVSRPPDGYPSVAEVQAAYDAGKRAFEVPRGYRVAQIFIAAARGVDKDGEEKARKRLEEVTRKLKRKGAEFAAVARTDSDEKTAAGSGGEIGWLTEGQMVPGIRAVVTGLASGAISDPIRLDDGWHVVKVLETRPASTRPLAEVREALAAELRAERAKSNRQAYLAGLLDRSPPAINELELSKLLRAQ